MTGPDLRAARKSLGISQRQLGELIGYGGENPRQSIGRMERGCQPIPKHIELIVDAFVQGYRPQDWPEKGRVSTWQ